MHSFEDADGNIWDVSLGRESWGTLVLLFAQRQGDEVRKTVLASETALEAQAELETLAEEELRERLARSQPWG